MYTIQKYQEEYGYEFLIEFNNIPILKGDAICSPTIEEWKRTIPYFSVLVVNYIKLLQVKFPEEGGILINKNDYYILPQVMKALESNFKVEDLDGQVNIIWDNNLPIEYMIDWIDVLNLWGYEYAHEVKLNYSGDT